MASVGVAAALLGYSLFYFGLHLVKGGNNSFVQLIWPGKYQVVPTDAQGGPGAIPNGTTTLLPSTTGTGTGGFLPSIFPNPNGGTVGSTPGATTPATP